MFKKVCSLVLSFCLVASLSACSGFTPSKSSHNKDYAKVITDAAEKLNSTYKDYIVSTNVEAPDGKVEYLNVFHDKVAYTEFSVDSDNNLGTIDYGSKDNIDYVLADWLTADGKYYIMSADDNKHVIPMSLPDGYTKYIKDKAFLYTHDIINNATSIKKYDAFNVDLGDGSQDYKSYKVTMKSDAVKKLIGANSWGIYDSISKSEKKGSNLNKLCSYYLQDLNMSLTFSDANVIFGIDNNGILKYVSLEVGGLGTKMYYTMVVVATQNNNVRTEPDLDSSKPYKNTMKDLADFVGKYNSYDEAMKALDKRSNKDSSVSNNLIDSTKSKNNTKDDSKVTDKVRKAEEGNLKNTSSK